jgi:hypothetical protein
VNIRARKEPSPIPNWRWRLALCEMSSGGPLETQI